MESFSIEALIFLLILAAYVLASYFIDKHRLACLHESTIAIALGFLTALFLRYALHREVVFSDEIFFALLLPPIVFSVGYGIRKAEFFQNFPSIVFLGVVSALMTISLFAGVLFLINSLFEDLFTVKDILLISIVISASDPIAALPLLKDNHAKLNAIVSGESILSSAVAIILFGTISSVDPATATLKLELVVSILLNFAYLLVWSLVLGLAFGLGLSYIFKKVESFGAYPIKETSLILLTAYMVYLIGELIGLSGIIALFTTAIIFSLYGFNNLSQQAKHGTLLAFETVRYISQAFIFAYLGASILNSEGQWSAFGISALIIPLIPVVRFLSVVLLPLAFKLCRKTLPLSSGEEKMLWYSGLMRGVIAFALSLQIESTNRAYIITIALIVVMTTTVVGASLLKPFARRVGLSELELLSVGERKQDRHIELMPATKYQIIGGIEQIKPKGEKEHFKSFEQKFIKPLFVKQAVRENSKTHIPT